MKLMENERKIKSSLLCSYFSAIVLVLFLVTSSSSSPLKCCFMLLTILRLILLPYLSWLKVVESVWASAVLGIPHSPFRRALSSLRRRARGRVMHDLPHLPPLLPAPRPPPPASPLPRLPHQPPPLGPQGTPPASPQGDAPPETLPGGD